MTKEIIGPKNVDLFGDEAISKREMYKQVELISARMKV